MKNSVMALRARELAVATKPFVTRGSKVVRCERCLLPKSDCICRYIPSASSSKLAVVMLMAKGEYYKPTNTGRLVADVVCDNHAFLWHRTTPQSALLRLLDDDTYQPIIVFPHEYAEPQRCIESVPNTNKKPLFIFLDGTWREAKRMFRKSAYLQRFPVLGVVPRQLSKYALRAAAKDYQLCTAEVAVEVFAVAGMATEAQNLAAYFAIFREHYLRGRPHHRAEQN